MENKILKEAGVLDQLEDIINIPDDQFSVLANPLLNSIRSMLNDSNQRFAVIQEAKRSGLDLTELIGALTTMMGEVDKTLPELSEVKRDFVKVFLGTYINVLVKGVEEYRPMVRVPIQKIDENAKIPKYSHDGDAGMDVFANEDIILAPGETKIVKTGLAVALPVGYELEVRPRSGLSSRTPLRVANSPGTIDSGYRDEIGIILTNSAPKILDVDTELNPKSVLWGGAVEISKGDRIAQLVLKEVPACIFYEIDDVKQVGNDRGGGFGSTGK